MIWLKIFLRTELSICLYLLILVKNFQTPSMGKNCHCWKTQASEYNIIQTQVFYHSKLRRDVKLQNTLIIFFKWPRDVLQINTFCQQLGIRSQGKEWYQDATSVPYGHLLIDSNPKTVYSLRYCSNSGSVSIKFYLLAGKELKFRDNEYTICLYSSNISKISLRLWKQLILNCPNKLIQCLSEWFLVNLLRGELQDLRKEDVVKYRKKFQN